MHWEMFVVVVHDTVDPQVVPGTAVGDVCRMQVAMLIEDVACTFLKLTVTGDIYWHHNAHDISNIVGAHVISEHPNLV